MKQLHSTQRQILKKLLFNDRMRYSDMKPDPKMENSRFNFHLTQLIDAGHIAKEGEQYTLTKSGKEYANRMDTEDTKVMRQSKIGAFVCPIRTTKDENEYLIYTREKQPFYGCQGFMSGKVAYGEKVVEAARRELKEETNLEGEPEVVTIRHFLVRDEESNDLLEDKTIFMCRVLNPTGDLQSNEEGDFEWVKESAIEEYVTKPFETMGVLLDQIEEYKNFDGEIAFEEYEHHSDDF